MVNRTSIDLHTHTTCSDGLLTPRELLDKAVGYGLAAISITDHDTLGAYDDASIFEYAKELGLELVPGIEFSTEDDKGHKYHILGFLIDLSDAKLVGLVRRLQVGRIAYAQEVSKLLLDDGWHLDTSAFANPKASVTKAHIARLLLEARENNTRLLEMFGRMPSEGELTEALLIKGKAYYVPSNRRLPPEEAIETIHGAGGLAILAHPAFNIMKGEHLEKLCDKFRLLGIDGFEAINIQFDKSRDDARVDMVEDFSAYARAHGLLITGGSDFHHADRSLIGNFVDLGLRGEAYSVDMLLLEAMKKAAKKM